MDKPFVVVVTGRPGAGKTTLAHALAAHIHCPALCRDEFKEGYVHSLGSSGAPNHQDINKQVYGMFFETVNFVVSKGVSVVIEAAFQHALWLPKLTQLAEVASVSVIVCTVDPQLARARWTERASSNPARGRFHGEVVAGVVSNVAQPLAVYRAPEMDVPTLYVDTTDGYDPSLEQIAAFVLATPDLLRTQH